MANRLILLDFTHGKQTNIVGYYPWQRLIIWDVTHGKQTDIVGFYTWQTD